MARFVCDTCEGEGWVWTHVCYGGPPVERRVYCPDCNPNREGEIYDDYVAPTSESKRNRTMTLNESLIMPIVDDNTKLIKVLFFKVGLAPHVDEDNTTRREYTYKTDLPVELGDVVAVETYNHWSVGRVSSVDVEIDLEQSVTMRWVVANLTQALINHDGRLKAEKELVDRVRSKRVRSMKDQLLMAIGITAEDAKALTSTIIEGDSHAAEHEAS